MMSGNQHRSFLLLFVLLISQDVASFTPMTSAVAKFGKSRSMPLAQDNVHPPRHQSTSLAMSSDNSGGGGGILPLIGAVLIGGLFLGTSILPMVGGGGGGGVAALANSVASGDSQQQQVVTNDKQRLSRAAIQEKLSVVPIFYTVGSNGEMDTNLFLSFADAKQAAGSKVVKATSLDQVEYPLVLKRGRMRMAPPPPEVQKAEEALGDDKTYKLVPSKQALADAAELKIDLGNSDFPLFVADRLAFGSGNGGLQVPLFLEKGDCLTSYTRLRGTNQNLPETPNIRSTTLNDELFSMEKGTRQGMSQLAFYSTAEDVNKAVELMGE